MVFLLMLVMILALVVLWNFDLHKIVSVKLRSQTAGDAAALAGARWQGLMLNLVGELNIAQAVAITDALAAGRDPTPEARAIGDLQARLCYVGPMTAVAASQLAAKNNRMHNNAQFTAEMAEHAVQVATRYPLDFPVEPYPDCWNEYATMLTTLSGMGIAAGIDNAQFYNDYANRDHLLLDPSFYDAIATQDWCWFYFNAYEALQNYTSWEDWGPLPFVHTPRPMNSEYLSLHLIRLSQLDHLPVSRTDLAALLQDLSVRTGRPVPDEVIPVEAQWYAYQPGRWGTWQQVIPEGFPWAGTVKEKYDYLGADAAMRIETHSTRLSPGTGGNYITWSAAAKPFGELEEEARPTRYGLVIPAFKEVRLIPVDTSTGQAAGSHPGWMQHIRDHLPPYVQHGPGDLVPGCWYCTQLRVWEEPLFRQMGLLWLADYAHTCHRPQGGPGGSSGGARRGH